MRAVHKPGLLPHYTVIQKMKRPFGLPDFFFGYSSFFQTRKVKFLMPPPDLRRVRYAQSFHEIPVPVQYYFFGGISYMTAAKLNPELR